MTTTTNPSIQQNAWFTATRPRWDDRLRWALVAVPVGGALASIVPWWALAGISLSWWVGALVVEAGWA